MRASHGEQLLDFRGRQGVAAGARALDGPDEALDAVHREQGLVEDEHRENVLADVERRSLRERRHDQLEAAEEVQAVLYCRDDDVFRRLTLGLGGFRGGLGCQLRCAQDDLRDCMPGILSGVPLQWLD